MPLETLNVDEVLDLVRGAIRGELTTATSAPDLSEGGDYDRFARMLSLVFTGNQTQGIYILRQIFPQLSDGEFTMVHAAARGLQRLVAAKSLGRVRIIGSSDGLVQGVGSILTHLDGTEYTLRANATTRTPTWTGKTAGLGSTRSRLVVLPSTTGMAVDDLITHAGAVRAIKAVIGTFGIDLYDPLPADPTVTGAITETRGVVGLVEASKAGKAGNKPTGETLTLSSPTAGITAATIVEFLGGGGDEETIDELKRRVAAHESGSAGGGNLEDWRQTARAPEGVRLDEAFVYPGFRGPGTIDIIAMGVTDARRVGADALELVAEHLRDSIDALADFNVFDAEHSAPKIDVDVTLKPRVGYEPDWVGSFTTNGVPTTTRIFVSATPVGTIEVGDRVLVPIVVGSTALLVQAKTTAVTATYVDVEAGVLPVAPAAGVAIRPGGPLVEGSMDAIDELFDSLGPGVSVGLTTYTRHPAPGEDWDDKLRVNHLIGSLLAVEGMLDSSVTAPASDQTPLVQQRLQLGVLTIRHG